MYHDIEREPLSFFLREVNLKKLSGQLFVTAKDFQISLYFMEGKLANGMSTRFDEKLSVILHLMGSINEEQYNFLSGLHQFSDDQVAGILLDHNFAKKKDIYYARIYQLRRIAISTFSLQQGRWIFTAGEPEPPLRETFEIPLAGILVEGARAVDHISFYSGKWLQATPVLFNEIPLDSEIYFTDAEREFYAAVQGQGRRRCQELIARLNKLPLDFWRSILAFHLMGIVEFELEEGAPDLSKEIAALLELNQRMLETAGNDPSLLGLPAHAPAAEIESAKKRLLARCAPERFGSAAAPEIKSIARAVCQRLQAVAAGPEPEAQNATRPGLRSEKDVLIEPVMPAWPGLPDEPGVKEENANRPGLPGDKDIPIEPAMPAWPRQRDEEDLDIHLEEPDSPGLPGWEEDVVEAEESAEPELLSEADMIDEPQEEAEPEVLAAADRIADPVMTAAAEPATEFPVHLDVEPELEIEMEIEPETALAAPQAPGEPPPHEYAPITVPPASLRMATEEHEKAWALLLQAKESYEQREYAKAIPLLKKAIRLEANQGDFYYLLGLCQSEAEVTRNDAEINLKKAIELKSWSADPVYALGVLYRSEGKMKLAERCFQRVKEIAYEHTGASRALVDLRRRRAGGPPPGMKRRKN